MCPDTGSKYKLCKLHGRKNEKGVQDGMYMPCPHNHKEWTVSRAKYNYDLKEKHQAKKSVNLKLMLLILLRNQIVGTFP